MEGRVSEVEDITKRRRTFRSVIVGDDTGDVRVIFSSGRGGADVQPGQLVRITGKARQSGRGSVSMVDPAYHVLEQPEETAPEEQA